jgi:hypothetical protein
LILSFLASCNNYQHVPTQGGSPDETITIDKIDIISSAVLTEQQATLTPDAVLKRLKKSNHDL